MLIKDYLKYYWLEKYLEDEVRSAFAKNHFLTAEQFFAIVEWKVPKFGKRYFSYLRNGDIEKLTKKIHDAGSPKERLEILLKDERGEHRRGIRLAMASAILTVLYDEEFTVYDVRVRKQLRKHGLWKEEPNEKDPIGDITYDKDVVDKYFGKYVQDVEVLARKNHLSLRDCDRALWAKDWYEDLQDFIKSVENSVGKKRKSIYK